MHLKIFANESVIKVKYVQKNQNKNSHKISGGNKWKFFEQVVLATTTTTRKKPVYLWNKGHYKGLFLVNGHEVLIVNNDSKKVARWDNIELQFTFGKKLVLVSVLHILDIRMNLISASLFCKKRLKAVLESDKIIISKNEQSDKIIMSKKELFVGNRYSYDGMFRLFINVNKVHVSAYSVVLSSSMAWLFGIH